VGHRRALLAALPLVTLAIAGCGGGGGDDESTESKPATTEAPTALSKAELIEQGDAICAEVNAAVGTVGTSSAETGNPAGQAADLYAGMIESLKNLGTPSESAGYDEFIAAADELATAEDEVKLATERGDETAMATAESNSSSALASFQAAAQEYGFQECSEGPSAPPVTAAPESGETGSAEAPEEAVEPEAVEPEAEEAPEVAPETGGAGGTAEGGGTAGAPEGGGGTTGGESGGIGPG
jgi:hypothetical protein